MSFMQEAMRAYAFLSDLDRQKFQDKMLQDRHNLSMRVTKDRHEQGTEAHGVAMTGAKQSQKFAKNAENRAQGQYETNQANNKTYVQQSKDRHIWQGQMHVENLKRSQQRRAFEQNAENRAQGQYETNQDNNEVSVQQSKERHKWQGQIHGENLKRSQQNRAHANAQESRAKTRAEQQTTAFNFNQRQRETGEYHQKLALLHKMHESDPDARLIVEQMVDLAKDGQFPMRKFLTPEYRNNFVTFKSVMAGKLNRNSPEALRAFNEMFSGMIKKGVGTPGPGGVNITDKNITGIYLDGGHLMLELGVDLEDQSSYSSPVTADRGTAESGDDNVLKIPIEDALGHVMGQIQLADALDHGKLWAYAEAMYEATLGERDKSNLIQAAGGDALELYANQQPGEFGQVTPLGQFQRQTKSAYGLPVDQDLLAQDEENRQAQVAHNIVKEAIRDNWGPNWANRILAKPDETLSEARAIASKNGINVSDELLQRAIVHELGEQKARQPQGKVESETDHDAYLDNAMSESEQRALEQLNNVEY